MEKSKNPANFDCEGGCGEPRYKCRCKPTRWCKNCRDFIPGNIDSFCVSPSLNSISLLTGERDGQLARAMRQDIIGELRCGTIARFYREKPVRPSKEESFLEKLRKFLMLTNGDM